MNTVKDGYQNIDQLKRDVIRSGSHFFDADTMRSFGSKVYPDLYGGRVFITSEKDATGFGSLGRAWNGQRFFTVRMIDPRRNDGRNSIGMTTLGAFGQYLSLGTARTAAKHYAKMFERCGEVHALEAMSGSNIYPRSEASRFCQRCSCGWESAYFETPEEARGAGVIHVDPYEAATNYRPWYAASEQAQS